MLVLSTTLLTIQAVFMPIGTVYAGTTLDPENQEQVELPPMTNYLEEQANDPRFFFTRSRMQGTVENPIKVTFFSDQEVPGARVFLPEEATLLKDQLAAGISIEQGEQPREWIVQSKRDQNTFVLPLVFEKAGNYELSVEEVTAHLDISEQEETNEEESVEETESSDEDQTGQEDLKEEVIENNQDNKQPAEEVRVPVIETPQEQQTDEEESYEEAEVLEPTVFDGETAEVTTMAQFREAVANPDIGIISVQANLTESTENVLTVDRPLLIQGNGYTLTFGNNGFYFQLEEVEEDRTLRIENAILTKTGANPLINASMESSRNWTLELEDIIEANTNTMRLASLPEGRILFTGGVSNFTRTASTQTFIEAKELIATNQAEVTISRGNATIFFSSAGVSNPKLTVKNGAKITITTASGTANTIDLRGEGPEIVLHSSGQLEVTTVGTTAAPTDTTNNAIALTGTTPKIAMNSESSLIILNTSAKRGIHMSGTDAQLVVNDSDLFVTTATQSAVNISGDSPLFSIKNSEVQLVSTSGQRINLIGSSPALTLHNSKLYMDSTSGRGIYLEGTTPQVFLETSHLDMTDTTNSQSMLLQGEDALLSLEKQSEVSITSIRGSTEENIRIGDNNARPELSITGGSKLSVTTPSSTGVASDTSNNAIHLRGDDPKATITGGSELAVSITSGARRGVYLNGANAELNVADSHFDVTTSSGQGLTLSGEAALLSLEKQSEVSITDTGGSTVENIQIGDNNVRPELLITGGSKLSVTTTSGNGAASDTSNNAIHLRGDDPKATITGGSELAVSITSGARRGVYLNGANAELNVADSQVDITTVSGQALNLTGVSPKVTVNKSVTTIASTTGQRLNLVGSNPVLTLDNSKLYMDSTSGRGIYLQGTTPQVFLETSHIDITDTGPSQGLVLQGEDALLSVGNKSELEINSVGTESSGTPIRGNIQIGDNNARPTLSVIGGSKLSVTSQGRSGAAASDTENNAIHLRGAAPVWDVIDSEVNINIISGVRKGIMVNGTAPEINIANSDILVIIAESGGFALDSLETTAGNTSILDSRIEALGSKIGIKNGNNTAVTNSTILAGLLWFNATNMIIEKNSIIDLNSSIDQSVFLTQEGMLYSNNSARQILQITTGSTVDIKRTDRYRGQGLRMGLGNSTVSVEQGGKLYIDTLGNGSPDDSQNGAPNAGVAFRNGNNNKFIVRDPGSEVSIIAQNGAAITNSWAEVKFSMELEVSNGGYFSAVSNTATTASGTFNVSTLDVRFDNPLFLDFRNLQANGGVIFATDQSSSLVASNSDLALWQRLSDLDSDPTFNFRSLEYSFSGKNLSTLVSTTRPEELNTSVIGTAGLSQFSRLSSNNGRWAIADELRVPTNADKKIHGRVSLPVGLNDSRPAWDDEAIVTVEVESPSGEKTQEYTTKTVGNTNESPGISIYGEEPRGGLFEIDLDEPLEAGAKVRISKVELTSGELTEGFEHKILTDTVEVFPIIPPKPAQFSSSVIAQDRSAIQGITDNVEAEVTATHNGAPLDTGNVSVDNEGKFTIDLSGVSLEEDDEIQIFLRDSEGSAQEAGVINPPETNNDRGNINPVFELTFHDVTFTPATTLTVGDVGLVSPVDPLDPEVEVDPENKPEMPEDQGPLSIDFISSFNFGSQGISVQDQWYYAQPQRLLNPDGTINEGEERPNYIQISDRRAENDRHGWQLAVTQNAQFTSLDDHQLTGARVHLMNQQFATAQGGVEPVLHHQEGVVLIPEHKTELITAKNEQGIGTWIYRFGDGTSAGESVALEVPKSALPRATTYQTTLTWELSAVPENE